MYPCVISYCVYWSLELFYFDACRFGLRFFLFVTFLGCWRMVELRAVDWLVVFAPASETHVYVSGSRLLFLCSAAFLLLFLVFLFVSWSSLVTLSCFCISFLVEDVGFSVALRFTEVGGELPQVSLFHLLCIAAWWCLYWLSWGVWVQRWLGWAHLS